MKVLVSSPKSLLNEAARINLLMARDFDVFHLRKPDWTTTQQANLLDELSPAVLKRTSLHQHHELARQFGIQRLHFIEKKRASVGLNELEKLKYEGAIFSTSVHSVDDYLALPAVFDYAFLSPVFDSISKPDYRAIDLDLSVKNPNVDVIALGGITNKNAGQTLLKGFDGIAMLGSIWKNYDRPIVLSVAGFDPSGGAGILADIKTIEQHKCLGFGVLTAQTVQTEDQFLAVEWYSFDKIIEQLQPLLAHYSIAAIKIGIIEDLTILNRLLNYLKDNAPEARIIWDPVLSASAGTKFHNQFSYEFLKEILPKVDLLTPNSDEVRLLAQEENASKAADDLSTYTNVLHKGGHRTENIGLDVLIDKAGGSYSFEPSSASFYPKHGSGCILSAAIACNLAHGQALDDACENAKRYIENVLNSNTNLLAYHAG